MLSSLAVADIGARSPNAAGAINSFLNSFMFLNTLNNGLISNIHFNGCRLRNE